MRERHTCLEGGNYAASAAEPRCHLTSALYDLPSRDTLVPAGNLTTGRRGQETGMPL